MGYYLTAALNAVAAALWFFNAGILMDTNPVGMWLTLFAGVGHAIAAGFNVMAQAIKEAPNE